MAEQADAITAVDDLRVRGSQQGLEAFGEPGPGKTQAGDDRLKGRVGHPAGGGKFIGGRCIGGSKGKGRFSHESIRIVDEPGSVLTKSAPIRELGVGKPGLQARFSTSLRIPSADCTVNEYPLAVRSLAVFTSPAAFRASPHT